MLKVQSVPLVNQYPVDFFRMLGQFGLGGKNGGGAASGDGSAEGKGTTVTMEKYIAPRVKGR